MKDGKPSTWLLLLASLPTSGATARMRVWRGIKALGCATLRDGAYLLTPGVEHARLLEDLARQTNSEGGQAYVVDVAARSPEDQLAFEMLFDRSGDYGELKARIAQVRKDLASTLPAELVKQLKRLRKDFERIQQIDYFPNASSETFRLIWQDFEEAVNGVLSPGEPHAEVRGIARLERGPYQGRTWATRRHLWADRVASAWLIRRFIDRDASFMWLASPADCPPDALGFDFDGAAFTHVGDKVSFEVLLASFGLEQDLALEKIGQTIHALDVGGAMTPEAAGFEAILSGASARLDDDDALLAEVGTVLDSLYAYYSKARK